MNAQELINRYNNSERDFSGVEIPNANLQDADLSGICLTGAMLLGANLRSAKMVEADLSYADLRGAEMGGIYLKGADLTGANLRGANISAANMEETKLAYANLRETLIAESNLFGADLRGANLRDAEMWGSDLSEADLEDAIMVGAVLPDFVSEDQLATAKILHLAPGQTYADAMMSWVDETFINDGLPGFDEGYEMALDDLVYYLEQYGMDSYGQSGQRVIAHFTEHAVDNWYGDFYRFNYCSKCQRQFRPDYDLDYANQVLRDVVLCPDCLVEPE
jgi:hypothetical protein